VTARLALLAIAAAVLAWRLHRRTVAPLAIDDIDWLSEYDASRHVRWPYGTPPTYGTHTAITDPDIRWRH